MLLRSLPATGRTGAAVAMTIGRILLGDLDDPTRALPWLRRAAGQAPDSTGPKRLLGLAQAALDSAKRSPKPTTSEENPMGATLSPEFINAEQRLACVLLLDTSTSMANGRIDRLNEGVATLLAALEEDELASKRVDLAIVTFANEVVLVQDFSNPDQWEAPRFEANGVTNMGEAIVQVLDRIESRKQEYRDNGIAYYRPWLFLLTDGQPTDSTELATQRLQTAQKQKQVKVFPVGVGDEVDLDSLAKIAGTPPVRLNESKWNEMFEWLSQSVTAVSHSQDTGEQVALPPPEWLAA